MVKKFQDIKPVIIENMKGGEGLVEKTSSIEVGEYNSDARVITRLVLRPGVSIGRHVHMGDEEIMSILRGKARYYEEGKEYILEEGDVTICLNGQEHSIENASETEDLEIYVVVNGC